MDADVHGLVDDLRFGRLDHRSRKVLGRIADTLGIDPSHFLEEMESEETSAVLDREVLKSRMLAAFDRVDDVFGLELMVVALERQARRAGDTKE